METNNPLKSYFRVPGLHVKLPSNGAFTPPEDLELSITGELAVFPMTAKDELWSKNPDGLLNGYSIENIIKSCVPGIKNPRKLPNQDIDYLLLAIKKASYGDTLVLQTSCPKCGNVHNFECSIDEVMSRNRPFAKEYTVRLSDELIAHLRPFDYAATVTANIAAFEEAKLMQNLILTELTEDAKVYSFSKSFAKIASMNLDLITSCVVKVVGPNMEVVDPKFIKEFLENAPKDYINSINKKMDEFKTVGIDRSIELECPVETCGHSWKSEISFDPSHFFE